MYGQIHVIVQSLVLEKFGEEAWKKIVKESGFDATDDFFIFNRYDDAYSIKLIVAVSTVLGAPLETVLEIFGEYFLKYCITNGYDKMLKTLGGDFVSFMSNLDSLHSLLSMTYPNFEAPSFRVETLGERVVLHYYSIRAGLHYIVLGLLRAVGRELFNSKVEGTIIDVEEIPLPGGKTQHHASFDVKIDCPKTAGKIDVQVKEMSLQKSLPFDADTFCDIFPFHIVFNEQMIIHQVGTSAALMSAGIIKPGEKLDVLFKLLHPLMLLTFENITHFINSVYIMDLRLTAKQAKKVKGGGIVLKGQIVHMKDIKELMFIGSPRLSDLNELLSRNMHLCDIPIYDVTRELVLLNQQRVAEIEVSKKLDEATAELKKLSNALESEKEKTDLLLYQMLPEKVALDLRDGKKCEAQKFNHVTILFSDIVSFTTIAAAVTPIDIVNMLNQMYNLFDTLSNENKVYKVETIGDAYMVVCGVPEPDKNHARSIANQGLGMILAAAKVPSPATGDPLQIRVGMHTGDIVAGVVGLKMPRYCLFGDSVNVASKMESNGIAGLLHMSPDTYEYLKDESDFKITKRGAMTIKGIDHQMTTYFCWSTGALEIEQVEVPPLVEAPAAAAPAPAAAAPASAGKSSACTIV